MELSMVLKIVTMPLKHKDKVKMARHMLTPLERSMHVPMFQSAAWDARKTAIEIRINRKVEEKFMDEAKELMDINKKI